MLPMIEPYAEQHSREHLRGLIFGAAMLAVISAVVLLWTTPSARPFGLDGKPGLPTYLWTAPYETPTSYSFVAETSGGEVRVWASAPDRWRMESPERTEVSTGDEVWDYVASQGFYWSIPFQHTVDAGVEPPRLQDGRPVTRDLSLGISTRMPLWGYLGPTTPESLMNNLRYVHGHGTWSLSEGTYLGRPVQVLELEVRNPPRNSEGQPFRSTTIIDPQYMFILFHEITYTGGPDDMTYTQRMTEITYNEAIADSVFVFEPPAGVPQCLPPQFQDRGAGCWPR